MTKETALIIQAHALAAIREIHAIVVKVPDDELGSIKHEIGKIIANIDLDILMPVYRKYPEIDDLAHEGPLPSV